MSARRVLQVLNRMHLVEVKEVTSTSSIEIGEKISENHFKLGDSVRNDLADAEVQHNLVAAELSNLERQLCKAKSNPIETKATVCSGMRLA